MDKNSSSGDGGNKDDAFMMGAIPRRSLPPARPPGTGNLSAPPSKAEPDALDNMTIPRRAKPPPQQPRFERGSSLGGSSSHGTSSFGGNNARDHHQLHRKHSNSGASSGGGSLPRFQQHHQQQQGEKKSKNKHVSIRSEYPFLVKIRVKGVPMHEGLPAVTRQHEVPEKPPLPPARAQKPPRKSNSVASAGEDSTSRRTPKRARPISYEEVDELDGLIDSEDEDESYAARPKKLRRGSQGGAGSSSDNKNMAASAEQNSIAASAATTNDLLDPGSGDVVVAPAENGLVDAPPPGVLSAMWYSRECFLHVFVVEKVVGWKRRPVASLEWDDPDALKFLDFQEALKIQQKTLANGDFWNDPVKRMEVSRINVVQCPIILAIAAEREKARSGNEGRNPQYKLKEATPPLDQHHPELEDVLLVKWRGRSFMHCSWERPMDIQKQDLTNTARNKIRRYYQAQEIALGKDWRKFLEEERATAAIIHSHGEAALASGTEQVGEGEEFFPPQCLEVERILGCDENEMDMTVLARQRAKNIRTEQEALRLKEEEERQGEGAGDASKLKPSPLFSKDLVDIPNAEDAEEDWDPEDNVRYVVKWKGLPYAEMTWEYWRDIKRDAVDEAEDFWQRQKPPSQEELQEHWSMPHPHVKDFRKLQSSKTYGITSRVRPVADLGDGVALPEEDDTDTKQGFQLRAYQLEGVNWLLFNWWNKRSCILADEMGLGKTVQTLGFLQELCSNPLTKIRGPFLIVAPLSLIAQWQSESRSWAPDFNVVLYHGSADAREFLAQQEFYYTDQFVPKTIATKLRKQHVTKFQILITTYEVVHKDIAVISKIRWKALIVDEAHRLKNPTSRLFAEMALIPRDYCVLLTGTPLANNTDELWALLHFDDPVAFSDREDFLEKFGQLSDSTQVNELHNILKPYLLRRVKEDVEKSLPPKEETILEVSLTPIQKKYYKAIYERNTTFLYKGAKPSNAPSLMNVMMELRKVCNHPYLVKGVEDRILTDAAASWKGKDENGNDQPVDYIKLFGEQLVKSSGKMVLLEKLLLKLFTAGHKVLIFSQMVRVLDLLEEFLKIQKYRYERLDGSKSSSSRGSAVDRFNRKACQRFVMLLSTRAGGLGLNLTTADIVIIFDSDWNPQNDLQAMARAHRIGQTRKVQIFRLLTAKTYEMHMFHSASMKLGLERAVLAQQRDQADDTDDNQKKSKNDKGAHAKEIDELLKKGAYDIFRDDDDTEAEKFMETDIDQLLERSSKKVTYGASSTSGVGSGLGSFSKASFVADTGDGEKDVDLDDPDFWAKAVGLEAPVETPDEVAQMIDDGVKRSRKQVQQYNPYDVFEDVGKEKVPAKSKEEKDDKDPTKLDKKEKKKKKKKKKEGTDGQEGDEKKGTKEGKEKKKKKKGDRDENKNGSLKPGSGHDLLPSVAEVPEGTVGEPKEKLESDARPKRNKKIDRRRAQKRAENADPPIERLKQAWEAPERHRATAAALRFGFGRFTKIRFESNLTSLPTQDMEIFVRSYTYQVALQVGVTFLAELRKWQNQDEQDFRNLIREWIGPGSEAEIEWLCSSISSVVEHHLEVKSCWRFLRMPLTLAEPSYVATLRKGAAFRALRRLGILSRLNRVVEEGLDSILSVLGHEELAKRGCGTSDLSTLDLDLRARHATTEELSLAIALHYREPVDLEAPVSWWDRNCDVALIVGSFVHGMGNYDAMRNDEELPFIHNIRSFAESDEACSSAIKAFQAAAASARVVFDEALQNTKAKAAREIQAAVAAAAATAAEREKNALAMRQGGAAADAITDKISDTPASSKKEVAVREDDRFVTLQRLQKAVVEAARTAAAETAQAREDQPVSMEISDNDAADEVSKAVEVLPVNSARASADVLPMPDSRVLDRRLIELLNKIECSLDRMAENYEISCAGVLWEAKSEVKWSSETRTKALSKLYVSQNVLVNILSEYCGVGINASQCGSQHKSLDDVSDYSAGAASADLHAVAHGVNAPRYLRAIGVPMNLTRFAICALIHADASTVEDMVSSERLRFYGDKDGKTVLKAQGERAAGGNADLAIQDKVQVGKADSADGAQKKPQGSAGPVSNGQSNAEGKPSSNGSSCIKLEGNVDGKSDSADGSGHGLKGQSKAKGNPSSTMSPGIALEKGVDALMDSTKQDKDDNKSESVANPEIKIEDISDVSQTTQSPAISTLPAPPPAPAAPEKLATPSTEAEVKLSKSHATPPATVVKTLSEPTTTPQVIPLNPGIKVEGKAEELLTTPAKSVPLAQAESKERAYPVPQVLKQNTKVRAAIGAAVLIYGFPSNSSDGSEVNTALWASLQELSSTMVEQGPPKLFSMGKFMATAKSLAENEALPNPETVRFYIEKILLPFCLRLCIMGNGPTTRNTRGSNGEFDTAFGVSLHPEPSNFVQSPLPDPCLEIDEQSVEALGYAFAILRRVRLLRVAQYVARGDVSVDHLNSAARSSFTCRNMDGLPLWWCPWVHDVALLVYASVSGLFAIIEDRKSGHVQGVFSREAITRSMYSFFVSHPLPRNILDRSAPGDVNEWIDLHAEEFPPVFVLERRLAFLCSQATAVLEGEMRFDNLPMFDHGDGPGPKNLRSGNWKYFSRTVRY